MNSPLSSPTPRRRRSRGEVLDTLATLFGNYVGGSNTTNDDGEDTASVSTSFTDRTPRKSSTTRHSITTPDDNESQLDTRRNHNHHNHHHNNNVEDKNVDDDRYEGEELAVAAAVRVNKENIRLRALVESTAERMQTALESLRDKDISQQHSLSIQIEKTTQLEKELASTRIELEKSYGEISTLGQEMENLKMKLQNETQRAEFISSEQRKQEKEMGDLKSQKLLNNFHVFFQTLNFYIYKVFLKKKTKFLRYLVYFGLAGPINFLSLLVNFFLPKINEMYFGSGVVVEK